MARSSRHKSHRQHRERSSREGRDRSESEEEERDARVEEPVAAAKTRVSRDLEVEKKKSSGRDLVGSDDDDFVEEHGRKRKEREEVSGRWTGGDEDDGLVGKGLQNEEIGDLEQQEKTTKTTVLLVDSASKSSRRIEGSVERNEDSVGKRQAEKDSGRRESSSQNKETKEKGKERRLEEDLCRRGSSSQYRDVKGRDSEQRSVDDSSRRESGSQYKKDGKGREKDQRSEEDLSWRESINQYKDTKDRSRERRSERDADDVAKRKQGVPKEKQKDNDDSEWEIRDDLRNPELEKELEKRSRRRDGSRDKEKLTGDDRDKDNDDRRLFSKDDQLSSRDDRMKNGSYKDERHKDRHRGDYDRDHRRHDDKYRDEHSSRNHHRSESKQHREDKVLEGQYKKSKLQDSDLDGSPYIDERDTRFKDKRERKRAYDETEDHSDFKSRNAKEQRVDRERAASGSSKVDSQIDGSRYNDTRSDKVDSHLSNCRRKGSPSSHAYGAKDRTRHISRHPEKGSPSGERLHCDTTSTGDHGSFSGVRFRDSDPLSSGKNKLCDDIPSSELLESAAASQYDQTPRSDTHASPVHSPTTSDWRSLDKNDLSSHEIQKAVQRNATSKDVKDFSLEDRGCELPSGKLIMENHSRADTCSREPASLGQSSFQKTGPQPRHLPPPSHARHGIDSPSVLGSYEDDTRVQSGDRKSSSRYRRSSDPGMGRVHGNAWKASSTWPSPAANGFIPLQPPPTGFHPAVQQFQNQPMFNVRPSIELHHSGVPYNIHDATERFPGHVRPFGWHNPVGDSCPPHLQVWDGSNGMFADETHLYGRAEWDQNRRMIENGGWEWKNQHGNMNVEFSAPQKESEYPTHSSVDETWVGQSGNWLPHEQAELERSPTESLGGKLQNGTHPIMNSVDTLLKTLPERKADTSKSPSVPQSSKTSNEDTMRLCCSYISKLDISANLARPELYEQCASLLEKTDRISDHKVSKHLQFEDDKAAAKTKNYMLNAFFPRVPDVIFQRAMSLYKEQVQSAKVKNPVAPLACSEDTKVSAEVPDAEKIPDSGKVDDGFSSPEAVNDKLNPVFNQMLSGDAIEANTESACDMEEDNNESAGVEGDNVLISVNEPSDIILDAVDANEPSGDIPDHVDANEPSGIIPDHVDANEPSGIIHDHVDANEPSGMIPDHVDANEPSGIIPDHVDANEPSGIIHDHVGADEPSGMELDVNELGEGSEPCEDLMQECRENLNRIHDPPKSTH